MTADTTVICKRCGRAEDVQFAFCIRHGWPSCCQETMSLTSPAGGLDQIDEAVGAAFDDFRLQRQALVTLLDERARGAAVVAQEVAEAIMRFDGHNPGTCECKNCTLARALRDAYRDYQAAAV